MSSRKILLLGAGGRLGAALHRAYLGQHQVTAMGRHEADLAAPQAVADSVKASGADVVINCAAMTNVDVCESERDLAETVNAVAPGKIAEASSAIGARMIHISTDYVFAGDQAAPYAETDEPRPISVYGETKLRGERAVIAAGEQHAVVRVAWVFGPDRDSFVDKALQNAIKGDPVAAVADKFSSPTYTLDVAEALAALFSGQAPGGTYHVCNAGVCTWRDWAQHGIDTASKLGVPIKTHLVEALRLSDIKAMIAKRPVYSAMSCQRMETLTGQPLRSWQSAVEDYVELLVKQGRLLVSD